MGGVALWGIPVRLCSRVTLGVGRWGWLLLVDERIGWLGWSRLDVLRRGRSLQVCWQGTEGACMETGTGAGAGGSAMEPVK